VKNLNQLKNLRKKNLVNLPRDLVKSSNQPGEDLVKNLNQLRNLRR